MRVTSQGSLGIGTTAPSGIMDIRVGATNNRYLFNNDNNVGFELRSETTGGNPYIDFTNDAGDYDARFQLYGNDYLAVTGANLRTLDSGAGLYFWGGGEGIIGDASNGIKLVTSSGTTRMEIANGGKVGIPAVTTDDARFHVQTQSAQTIAIEGDADFTGGDIGVYGYGDKGVVGYGNSCDFRADGPSNTDYCTGSSLKWKTNITEIPNALAKVAGIRGVYFNWNAEHGGEHDIGFIAEEMVNSVPEMVGYEGENATYLDYSKITPLLVQAIKELKAENDALKVRLAVLEKK